MMFLEQHVLVFRATYVGLFDEEFKLTVMVSIYERHKTYC